MNMIYTPVSPAQMAARWFSCRHAGVSAAALLALCAGDARAQNWVNSDVTSPPGASQAWSIGANWTGGVAPLDGANVNVQRWNGSSNVAAFVLLDTQTNLVGAAQVNYGSELLITSAGEFRNGLAGRLEIGSNAASTVTVESGGKITLAEGTLGANVRFLLNNASTLNTAGVINHNYLAVQGGSTVNMTGGSITTRQTFNGVQVSSSSTFSQSAGDLITSGVQLNSGNYVVSGGTITTSGANGLYVAGTSTEVGSSFTVRGSGASVNFSSYRNDSTGTDVVRPTFAFVLDNSSQHISKINFSSNGSTGATLRTTADLDVSLAGGVLLSGVSSHTVIQRVSGTDTAWNNSASLTGLWVDTTDNTDGTTKADIKIGLNAAADRGNFNVSNETSLDFGQAFAHGYIDLSGVDDQSFQLALDIAGGTLANFTSALTEAGIGWTAGAGEYEVVLDLDAAISGGNYFAWDFSTIDDAMGLQGVGFVTVPEPSSFAALAGLGVLGAVLLRRRRA